jgi:hypothetical protein
MSDQSQDAIRTVMLESANVQLAAMKAGIAFWREWVDVATEMSDLLGSELATIARPDAAVDASVGKLTDASLTYIRRVTEISNTAIAQFRKELGTTASQRAKPPRSAKTKQ